MQSAIIFKYDIHFYFNIITLNLKLPVIMNHFNVGKDRSKNLQVTLMYRSFQSALILSVLRFSDHSECGMPDYIKLFWQIRWTRCCTLVAKLSAILRYQQTQTYMICESAWANLGSLRSQDTNKIVFEVMNSLDVVVWIHWIKMNQ